MSIGCAVSVANIYYNQPLLPQMGASFHAAKEIGYLPGFSQAGVALGMFAFVPLGDMFPRRRLIVTMCAAVALCALATALAPSLPILFAEAFLIGLTTIVPHLILPFAAKLASPELRGRVLGNILGGLLIGILLARVVSGFLGDFFGWRVMYAAAACSMVALAFTLHRLLPEDEPESALRYPDLLRSLLHLARTQPMLREAAIEGAMFFGAFSAFWATLVFFLAHPPYAYGPRIAGLFGLVGAAGAAAAPLAGRLSDRKGPAFTVAISIAISLVSFAIFAAFGKNLSGLILGVILLDLGVQAGHVANQTRIYSLIPEARSRLNTVYMVSYFIGGALGSLIAAYGWQMAGWAGVCGTGAALLVVAALARWYAWFFAIDRSAKHV